MKYMGSKRYMLANGLGELLRQQLPKAKRFIDPFSGSGGVINYAAVDQGFPRQIISGDLQEYSAVLARSIIGRTKKANVEKLLQIWIEEGKKRAEKSKLFDSAAAIDTTKYDTVEQRVKAARKLCEKKSTVGPIWNAYGGHYFSPKQALGIDHLLRSLPKKGNIRDVCRAALIIAASRAAAAPGHTAQPFQPTEGASKFIEISWRIDIYTSCETALNEIAPKFAKVKGMAFVIDAKKMAAKMKEGDLVFLDPPYSGVQYSRFYHVLETIAKGRCGKVTGVGRYPSIKRRPQSEFSNIGQSVKALDDLLAALAKKKVKIIFTFPNGEASNGLSGDKVLRTAQKYFSLDEKESRIHTHAITGKFSTLGGNNKTHKKSLKKKKSRVESVELVLLLTPKK